jgi:polar amino acid transport system substrate-binding protein
MRRSTPPLRAWLALAILAVAAFGPSSASAAGGKLVFCSDITYPPEEFYQGGKPVGSDIDIGRDVAKRLGRTAQFDNTGFDGIIASLLAKKCDLIISGMNDTPERRKQVGFVDYIKVGQSLMVKAGNPAKISTLSSLAGKSVAVEVGTTNKTFLDQESKKLKKAGKQAIKVTPFPKDTAAAAALKTGRVDAYFGDSPVVAYYVQQDKSLAFGGSPVNPILVGIAVRKDDATLKSGVQKAIDAMYKDGTMKRILAKWKMSATALKK